MVESKISAAERRRAILRIIGQTGFAGSRDLEAKVQGSLATIRRDLRMLESSGYVIRVPGGAVLNDGIQMNSDFLPNISRLPFSPLSARELDRKRQIGRVAAAFCEPGESVMIDGGSTTLEMCPYLASLGLTVLTSSLQVASALLMHARTRIVIPAGTLVRERNIILASGGEDCLPRFHAPKLFMSAEAICPSGAVQSDPRLSAAVRPLINRAEQIIMLVESSKFRLSSGAVACSLEDIDVLVTDDGIGRDMAEVVERAGVRLLVA